MNVKPLLSGADLVREKLSGQREIPSMGLKEFRPSNSWLEKKQIKGHIDELYGLLNAERIEKISNLSKADWDPSVNKAKVTKKVGKHWETFGHYELNSDWLYPEEALFLLETSTLELYYGGVRMSVEQSYSLLLGESCSLNEYRVYSYLSRTGYKVIHHKIPKHDEIMEIDKEEGIEKPVDLIMRRNNVVLEKESSPENDVEIIETPPKNQMECVTINDSDSDDDVIYVATGESQVWYSTRFKFLTTQDSNTINLTEPRTVNFNDLKRKTRFHILNSLPNVKSGLSKLTAPDARLLPRNVTPRFTSYSVNLRKRDEQSTEEIRIAYENQADPTPKRIRPLLSNPLPYSPSPRRYGGQMVRMQAMAFQMMQTASTIMSAYNNPAPPVHSYNNKRPFHRRGGFRQKGSKKKALNGQRPSCSNVTISLDSDDEDKTLKRQGSPKQDTTHKKPKVYELSSSESDDDCSFIKDESKPSSSDQACLEMLKDFKSEVTRLNTEVEELIKNSIKNESSYVQTSKQDVMEIVMTESNVSPDSTEPTITSRAEAHMETETAEVTLIPNQIAENPNIHDITMTIPEACQDTANVTVSPENNNAAVLPEPQTSHENANGTSQVSPEKGIANTEALPEKLEVTSVSEAQASPKNTIATILSANPQPTPEKSNATYGPEAQASPEKVNVTQPSYVTEVTAEKSDVTGISEAQASHEITNATSLLANQQTASEKSNATYAPEAQATPEKVNATQLSSTAEALPRKPDFNSVTEAIANASPLSANTQVTPEEPNATFLFEAPPDNVNVTLLSSITEASPQKSNVALLPTIITQALSEKSHVNFVFEHQLFPENESQASPKSDITFGPLSSELMDSEDSKVGGEMVLEEIQKIYCDLPEGINPIEEPAPISWAELKNQSLIKPENASDMTTVLKTLQIFKPITSQLVTKDLKVSYDVYLPTDHYKKSANLSPRFRIIVMQGNDALPTTTEMDNLFQIYKDKINFVYAIVSHDSISFFLYDNVKLPVIHA